MESTNYQTRQLAMYDDDDDDDSMNNYMFSNPNQGESMNELSRIKFIVNNPDKYDRMSNFQPKKMKKPKKPKKHKKKSLNSLKKELNTLQKKLNKLTKKKSKKHKTKKKKPKKKHGSFIDEVWTN
mgnify:CR=1 FL=1